MARGRDERVSDLFLIDLGSPPSEEGQLRQVGNDVQVFLGGSAVSLISGTGLNATTHQALRQLAHFIDDGPACGFASGAYKETLPSADPFPTSVIWWESAAKTEKVVELTISRNANKTPSTEVWEMYDTDGTTVLCTVSDAISYSGVFETSRTRTIT